MKKFLFILGQSLLFFNLTFSQNIELKEIMKGDAFIGHQPENHEWSSDGKHIMFTWNPENELNSSSYYFDFKSNTSKKIDEEFIKNHVSFDASQNQFSIQYFTENGNLYAYDKKKQNITLIISSKERIRNIQRVANQNHIYLEIDNNLFLYDATIGSLKQVTNLINGRPSTPSSNSNFLIKQQEELFQFIREEIALEEVQKTTPKILRAPELPKAYYYDSKRLRNLQISPDEKFITFSFQINPTKSSTHVEHHITTDGQTQSKTARPKVSEGDPNCELFILNRSIDSIYQVDFSSLPDIRKKPAYLNDSSSYDKDRHIIMHSIIYNKNGGNNAMDIRSYDNKDRWITQLDLNTGKVSMIDHQHSDAWIGGPGISNWNMVEGVLGWLHDNTTLYYQSEQSGYSHLYTYSTTSKNKEQLTSGKYEVHDVILSSLNNVFYITTNKTHPGNRSVYKLELNKNLTPIFVQDGAFEVQLSPDEKQFAVRYSYKNKPWELFVARNEKNAVLKQLTYSQTKEFEAIDWYDPEVITFNASDGIDVFARIYKPLESTKNGAAVIFVHGAGYLQNAHNFWSGYHREYMFHNLLIQKGYTVLDIDYRASKGYGEAYRTAIYQHMGGRDLQDHIDGKKYLVEQLGIDSERVGIYGGSYGGFITLMALLTEPDVYACGAALRSVTDWAHYNHEYTSNILNYPETDPEAYRRSSPIYFAENLSKPLIMLHGMVDDNVQFQDVVRLSQRFIELGKEDWELAVYPVEAHGFVKAYSWTDEYRRILELFDTHLLK